MRNSRAEKYLLLRSLVRTVAATRVSVQIREIRVSPSKKYSRNSLVFTEESRIFAAEKI